MTYEPQVNDYVIWKPHIKGWVYYKHTDYITIESRIHPKDDVNLLDAPFHANNRLLVICYPNQWNELTYIKSRKSFYEENDNFLQGGP
jgi:hypothetical protein